MCLVSLCRPRGFGLGNPPGTPLAWVHASTGCMHEHMGDILAPSLLAVKRDLGCVGIGLIISAIL